MRDSSSGFAIFFLNPLDLNHRLQQTDLARHAYFLGSTGSGKTNFIMNLIEQDLDAGQSIVVLDLRGDLVERTLSLCEAKDVHSGRVALLDLREKEYVAGFNPLAGDGEPFVRALHLLDVVRTEADSWGVQIDEVMRNAFLLLAATNHPVTDIERLLFDMAFLTKLLEASDDPAVSSFFERYQALSEEKQLAWALPVLNKLTPLFATKGMRAILGADQNLNLERILETKGSVLLISLAVDELHRTGRMLGSLLVSAISRTMLARVNVPEEKRNPVRLYVDEFENMASETFESLIAEGRRFKFSLVLSHQNLAQIPPRLKAVIRNNVGLQGLFCCGYQDAKELMWELPEGFTVARLTSLQPGELLLMPRAGESQLVRCTLSRKHTDQTAILAYREEVLRDTGTPIAKVLLQVEADRQGSASLQSLRRPWDLGGGACN
ncbi:MAG: type IV secretory system conjugative DNA transfer family protein [Armatimonadetes bacterium]|nr:type IV secretory system conjugative DNA transfer family protein [Armatimonadota bacterium]